MNALLKKFYLGDVSAKFDIKIAAEASKALDILPSESVTFAGQLEMSGSFAYEYPGGWSAAGWYEASLEAGTAPAGGSPAIANGIGIRAKDDDMFDSKPPAVRFNFDVCDYRDRLASSVAGLELSGALGPVLDEYLAFDEDFAGGYVAFDSSFTNRIKAAIVSSAEAKASEVKSRIVAELNSFPCSGGTRRRLDQMMEIDEDGSVRALQNTAPSFEDLAAKMLNLPGARSAFAGYFASRGEVAVDLDVRIEESLADTSDFLKALTSAFDKLGPAQSMFNASATEKPDVAGLLDDARVAVAFDLSISAGFKINDLMAFFASSASESSLGSLFLRLNDLGVEAKASASGVSVDLFEGIGIVDGSFALSAGVRLDSPFEAELTATGDFVNGIELTGTVLGQLSFSPHGELAASLPFEVTIKNIKQSLVVLMNDADLFDDVLPLLRVDFDVCSVGDVMQSLIGTLGSIDVSAQSILGPMSLSGIDFFKDELSSTLDDLFPDVSQFAKRVLSAGGELFHLCQEIKQSGEDPPTLEDVVSHILEDVLGTSSAESSTSAATGDDAVRRRRLHEISRSSLPNRRRALRARHLMRNSYIRPQRYLQEEEDADLVGDLLDSLSVSGGFDGSKIFIRFVLDLSKQVVSSLDDIIQAPLSLLNEVDFLKKLLPGSAESSPINLDLSMDLNAGAHLSLLGMFPDHLRTCAATVSHLCFDLFSSICLLFCSWVRNHRR